MMDYKPVVKEFFNEPTIVMGRKLLGCYLVHKNADGLMVGKIVETEAYLGSNDPAAHTYKGETHRTRAMFGPAGHAYIYFSYGNHYCLNVTANKVGVGEGVLLRALEPVEGVELMRQRRHDLPDTMLTNGPGKLVQALGITQELYGHDLTQLPLYIAPGQVRDQEVMIGPRIGISKAVELPLRFWLKESEFVSRKR